jgi:hypothetical protein
MLEITKDYNRDSIQVWLEDYDSNTIFKEYKKTHSAKNGCTSYVESQYNRRFRICVDLKDVSLLEAYAVDIYIDGQFAFSGCLGKWSDGSTDKSYKLDFIYGGPGKVIPFRFGGTEYSGTSIVFY